MSTNDYVLGHSAKEIERLKFQAALLRPYTHRMLIAAGLCQGMRVLDIGCGTGAVSLLASELTGPRGQVIAIDRSESAIEAAVDSARSEGVSNVHFKVSALNDFADDERFDMVVGRYVLVHQPDAVEFLKKAALFVRPGGSMAFHEIDLTGFIPSSPTIELWDAAFHELLIRFQKACPEAAVTRNMVHAFVSAGFPVPDMFCEVTIGGANIPFQEWMIRTLQSLSDGAERTRLADGRVIEFEAAILDLARAIEERHAQVQGPYQVCAWAHLPDRQDVRAPIL
ncbi:class I SAM-dependent methyltransferase [Pararobbsia alpina]|uniref:Ubiquinone biosynthesis O-methyltransferase, mitochondrial n=1 Tax=Pararobbsia alpina TaxID=621374 RepID=A0A6S7BLZ9_9BURK|nr:class I SAM-dependent methyltransferase [Pararobbsia alpina]CAB3792983.1 Ubiquinone biosynthesis O-methyltransferase, mitochondrial [Pararobbsia alpina]